MAKVLVLDYVVNGYGGIERVNSLLFPEMLDEHEIYLFDIANHDEYASKLSKSGVVIISNAAGRLNEFRQRCSAIKILKTCLSAVWTAASVMCFLIELIRLRPDLVIICRIPLLKVFAWVIIPKTKLIYYAHGFASAEDIGLIGGYCIKNLTHGVISVSRYTKNQLVSIGIDESRIAVVHNAINLKAWTNGLREEKKDIKQYRNEDRVRKFAYCGAVTPNKSVDLIVRVFMEIIRCSSVELVICGDAYSDHDRKYLSNIKHQVELNEMSEKIKFLGWREDVAQVLESIDFLILVSKSESFGMVLLEAMALGKPCIGSNRGGIPEIITDGLNGFICEPREPDLLELVNKIISNNVDVDAMSENAIATIKERFSIELQKKKINDIIIDVIGR